MHELQCVAAPEAARRTDLAAARDLVAEIYAGYVVAGTAFKVVLRAVFGSMKASLAAPSSASRPGRREVWPFRTFANL